MPKVIIDAVEMNMSMIDVEQCWFICMCQDCKDNHVHSAVFGLEAAMAHANMMYHKKSARDDKMLYYEKTVFVCVPMVEKTILVTHDVAGFFDRGEETEIAKATLESREIPKEKQM